MTGRSLPPTSRFATDDGVADPALATALAACTRGDGFVADVVAALAAAAAAAQGRDLLVVDPGAAGVVVPRPAVAALASGVAWHPAVQAGRVSPEVAGTVTRALDGVVDLLAVEAVPGRRGEVAVLLTVRPGLSRAELDALVTGVCDRLVAQVSDFVDSLELRVSGGDAG